MAELTINDFATNNSNSCLFNQVIYRRLSKIKNLTIDHGVKLGDSDSGEITSSMNMKIDSDVDQEQVHFAIHTKIPSDIKDGDRTTLCFSMHVDDALILSEYLKSIARNNEPRSNNP